MSKSKLGVSAAILGASLYFIGLSGLFSVILVAGYVLLCEEDSWLRKNAVRAIAIVLFFTVLSSVLNLLPNAIDLINQVLALFKADRIDLGDLDRIISILRSVLSIGQTIILILSGFAALNNKSHKFGPVDKIVDKHTA